MVFDHAIQIKLYKRP